MKSMFSFTMSILLGLQVLALSQSETTTNERSQAWVSGLPKPSSKEEKKFFQLLLSVHESTDGMTDEQIKNTAVQFDQVKPAFQAYVSSVLEMLSPVTDQKEKNFVYIFSKTAVPHLKISPFVVQDIHILYRSGTPDANEDNRKLTRILLSQRDLKSDELHELIDQYGISQTP